LIDNSTDLFIKACKLSAKQQIPIIQAKFIGTKKTRKKLETLEREEGEH